MKNKETLEEAAQRLYPIELEDDEWDKNKQYRDEWIEGAKWQQERMYSDMQEYAEFCIRCYEKKYPCIIAKDWFDQFKNK